MLATAKGFVDYYRTKESELKDVAIKFTDFASDYVSFFLDMSENAV